MKRKRNNLTFYYIMEYDIMFAMNWITTDKQLPEVGQRVLVSYSIDTEKKVAITIYDKVGFAIGFVDAWLPLPEPYDEKKPVEVCCRTCQHNIGIRDNIPCLNCICHNQWKEWQPSKPLGM